MDLDIATIECHEEDGEFCLRWNMEDRTLKNDLYDNFNGSGELQIDDKASEAFYQLSDTPYDLFELEDFLESQCSGFANELRHQYRVLQNAR
jgi:hypothetical protein